MIPRSVLNLMNRVHFTCHGIHYKAGDGNIIRQQRVVPQKIHRFGNGVFNRIKSAEPRFKIHTTVAHHFYVVVRNASRNHVRDHFLAVHVTLIVHIQISEQPLTLGWRQLSSLFCWLRISVGLITQISISSKFENTF